MVELHGSKKSGSSGESGGSEGSAECGSEESEGESEKRDLPKPTANEGQKKYSSVALQCLLQNGVQGAKIKFCDSLADRVSFKASPLTSQKFNKSVKKISHQNGANNLERRKNRVVSLFPKLLYSWFLGYLFQYLSPRQII